jgi:O-antigen/teichoic acid export membrane protein
MSLSTNTRGFLSSFGANIIIQGCNIATGILAARLLLPVGRGELASVILWPVILESLGQIGTSYVLAREAAANPDQESNLARTAVILGLTLGCLVAVLGYFLVPHLLPADKQHLISLTRILLLMIPLNYVAFFLLSLDQGLMRWTRYNLMRFATTFFYLLAILVFWSINYKEVKAFVTALLLSFLIIGIFRILLHGDAIVRGRTNIRMCLRIVKLGTPFFLAAISLVVAGEIDKTLVVGLLPMEIVGCYAAAITFASAHLSLGSALGVTSFVCLAHEPDPGRRSSFLVHIFRQSTWLYLIAGSGVALLAPILITPLFGPQFHPAVKPAAILAIATSLVGLSSVLNEGLRGMGMAYPGTAANLLGGGLVALAAWHLIPAYGLMGMAEAAVLGALARLIFLTGAVAFLLKVGISQLWGLRVRELKAIAERIYQLIPAVKG